MLSNYLVHFFKINLFLNVVCMCMSECGYVHVSTGACGGYGRQISLELDLQAAVSCLMLVMGIEPWFSVREVCVLDH